MQIPPRTAIETRDLTIALTPDKGGWHGAVELTDQDAGLYRCLDCGYQTAALAEMENHQAHQAEVHTLWQRIWRAIQSS